MSKILKKKNIVKSKKQKSAEENGTVKRKILKDDGPKPKAKKSKDYGSMTIDDFMNEVVENSSDDEQTNNMLDDASDIGASDNSIKNGNDMSESVSKLTKDTDQSDSDLDDDEHITDELKSHKQALSKLKDIDPEFYKFLEENDKKLLNFNVSDSEDEDAKEQDDDEETVHKPSEGLEVASDESDFEPDGEEGTPIDGRIITLHMLRKWQVDIQSDKTSTTIGCLTKAFHAALIRVSSDDNQNPGGYKVDGSSVFNAVVQLCVLELGSALRRYLKLPTGSKLAPHKCKRFVKIKTLLKGYLTDLLKLLGGVTSTNIQNVLLKHLHGMSAFVVSYSSIAKKILKRLVNIWGTAEETVRVVAFLCILRITTNQQSSYLDLVLKAMYMTYIKNCKFMSTTTIAEINFMRRSLAEIFSLDINVSYQHVFLYIRQLAIHLRSAVMLHKKENIQAVYNWQYVNSLHLWATVLTLTCNKPQLQPLIYPLVQVAIGTIKLVPTAQYFPLRFHCLQILNGLSRDTNIFIPILPFMLEVLTSYDYNKKNKKVSMKPLQLTCLVRVSKSQMMENGFKDAVIDSLYGLLLEYLAHQSHSISFPDTTLLCVMQIKQFLKKCSVSNYCRKMRQILEKIEQNTQFIEKERKKINFNITDLKQIDAWETNVKNMGTPIGTFFENWKKLNTVKKIKQASNSEAISDFNLPILKKGQKPKKVREVKGQVELFPSDSESDDNGPLEKVKPKRGKRGSKKTKMFEVISKVDDGGVDDIVEDVKASDW